MGTNGSTADRPAKKPPSLSENGEMESLAMRVKSAVSASYVGKDRSRSTLE